MLHHKKFLILFFFSAVGFTCLAQSDELDLLKQQLSNSKEDTTKLHLLFQLVESISDDSVWIPYNNQLGKLALALMQSEDVKTQLAAKKYYASYYNNLGYASENKGNIPVALDYYYKSLKLHESANDSVGISMVLNNIGFIKNKQDDKQAALAHFKHSLSIQQKIADSTGMALSLLNIGGVFDNNGYVDSALMYYTKSLVLSQAINDRQKAAMALSNIGGIYDKRNVTDSALFYYRKSLAIQEEINDKAGIAVSKINFGNIYLREQNYPLAQKYFEQSMNIAKEIGYIEIMRGAALWLSKIYAIQNNFQGAYNMQVLYKQLADSINNTETRKEAVKKQMQYDYEKKEAIIKAEHDKKEAIAITEIKKQQQVKMIILIASVLLLVLLAFGFYNFYNRRKETFRKTVAQINNKALRAQMNPHFIFNSLNSIQDFINTNDSKNANTYIVKFAKLVRMILENSRKQEVLLSEDLHALELYMQLESLRIQNGFDYDITIDSMLDVDNTLVPPLIIQPFVENAIWHGLQHKKERGKISIYINKKENNLECIVEDNGVGRIAALEAKQFRTTHKQKSLGMEITSERIKLYNNIKNSNAFFEISDLFNSENVVSGMRVLLLLPFEEAN